MRKARKVDRASITAHSRSLAVPGLYPPTGPAQPASMWSHHGGRPDFINSRWADPSIVVGQPGLLETSRISTQPSAALSNARPGPRRRFVSNEIVVVEAWRGWGTGAGLPARVTRHPYPHGYRLVGPVRCGFGSVGDLEWNRCLVSTSSCQAG